MPDSALQTSISPRGEHLVLYDGVCALCNRLNNFVLPRDNRGVFDFASLQSAMGRSALQRFGRNPDDLNTFYLVTNYRSESSALLSKASAALFVMKKLGDPWRWLGLLARKIRDFRNTEGLAMVQIRYRRGFETKNEAFT